MSARQLSRADLARRCDPATLDPDLPLADESASAAGIVGQERARAAVEFGIATSHPGFHLFVMGPAGSGRRSLTRHVIGQHMARNGAHRQDWVYVHRFDRPHQPVALALPMGRGQRFRADMRELVHDLRTLIQAAFESEEYATQVEQIAGEFKERADAALTEVAQEAQRRDLAMIRTPMGLTLAPRENGEVMTPERFQALPEERRNEIQKAVSEVQERLLRTLRANMRMRKEHADRVRELDRSMTLMAVEHAVDDLKHRYADLPEVVHYLDAVRADVIENARDFRTHEEAEEGSAPPGESPVDLGRYEVNLVVDAGADATTPIIEADHPTYQNLVGRVDHVARFGALLTDFRLIKGGLLHRANGGYLLVDALKLVQEPYAWPALKRALQKREIRIESMAEMFSIVSTVQLEPDPIPLDAKVVLIGERWVCSLLQAHDPEFDELFRVVADVGDDMPRARHTEQGLARVLATHLAERQALPAGAPALACLLDHGVRLAGDSTRITAQVRRLLDVLLEAEHLARQRGAQRIEAADVQAAISASRERAARVHERERDAVQRHILMIATSGERVGQVNGLSVYQVGNEAFGTATRITATSRIGDGQVIDIQRETHLGGPLHTRGVLILTSYLAARYSRLQPHAIVASLVLEQTYGLVEGDSASLGELVALLSSIADVPVRQCHAVTGSVNQLGDVQAIGGVNEKIEGFFDICAARGLDGRQGVLIPQANVEHLMLREDVVEAVAAGRFHVHAVETVDDAVEVMTGMPLGVVGTAGSDTVNGRITRRLREYARLRRGEIRMMRRRVPGHGRVLFDEGDAP